MLMKEILNYFWKSNNKISISLGFKITWTKDSKISPIKEKKKEANKNA